MSAPFPIKEGSACPVLWRCGPAQTLTPFHLKTGHCPSWRSRIGARPVRTSIWMPCPWTTSQRSCYPTGLRGNSGTASLRSAWLSSTLVNCYRMRELSLDPAGTCQSPLLWTEWTWNLCSAEGFVWWPWSKLLVWSVVSLILPPCFILRNTECLMQNEGLENDCVP